MASTPSTNDDNSSTATNSFLVPALRNSIRVHAQCTCWALKGTGAAPVWSPICHPGHHIKVGDYLHFYLPNGEPSSVFPKVVSLRTLEKHSVEFLISYPILVNDRILDIWAYLTMPRPWANLSIYYTAKHFILQSTLIDSIPRLPREVLEGIVGPCTHVTDVYRPRQEDEEQRHDREMELHRAQRFLGVVKVRFTRWDIAAMRRQTYPLP